MGLFSNNLGCILGIVFEQSGQDFRDCFLIVRAEFLGLFLDSLDRILGTIFGQSGIDFQTVCMLFSCVIEKYLNNMLVVWKSY